MSHIDCVRAFFCRSTAIAAATASSPSSFVLRAVLFFVGDQLPDTLPDEITRKQDPQWQLELLKKKFPEHHLYFVVFPARLCSGFSCYDQFLPQTTECGEPMMGYKSTPIVAIREILKILQEQDEWSTAKKKSMELVGFSKGGVVLNQVFAEMSRLAASTTASMGTSPQSNTVSPLMGLGGSSVGSNKGGGGGGGGPGLPPLSPQQQQQQQQSSATSSISPARAPPHAKHSPGVPPHLPTGGGGGGGGAEGASPPQQFGTSAGSYTNNSLNNSGGASSFLLGGLSGGDGSPDIRGNLGAEEDELLELAHQYIRGLHYVDCGLNSRGAYIAQPRMINSFATTSKQFRIERECSEEENEGAAATERFFVTMVGTWRQWDDPQRPWVKEEQQKFAHFLRHAVPEPVLLRHQQLPGKWSSNALEGLKVHMEAQEALHPEPPCTPAPAPSLAAPFSLSLNNSPTAGSGTPSGGAKM